MYMRYVEAFADSSIARDYRMTVTKRQVDEMVHIYGGHFATSLFENRLNDAWYHADFNNRRRMLYLGFRNNMKQSYEDCGGLECKLDDDRFVSDIISLVIHLDKTKEWYSLPIDQ